MHHLAGRFGGPKPLGDGVRAQLNGVEFDAVDWWWFYTGEVGAPKRSAGGLLETHALKRSSFRARPHDGREPESSFDGTLLIEKPMNARRYLQDMQNMNIDETSAGRCVSLVGKLNAQILKAAEQHLAFDDEPSHYERLAPGG